MNKTVLLDKRCADPNCNWLMFRSSKGNTRIEHKCQKCGKTNIVDGVEDKDITPVIIR